MTPSNPPPEHDCARDVAASPPQSYNLADNLADWLAAPLDLPAGIGPRRRLAIEAIIGRPPVRREALLRVPRSLLDLSPLPGRALSPGVRGAFRFEATSPPRPLGRRGRRLDGRVDGTALALLWFRAPPAALLDRLTTGSGLLITGAITTDASGALTCAHPKLHRDSDNENGALSEQRIALYQGLDRPTGRLLQQAIATALAQWPEAPSGPSCGALERRALAVLHGIEAGDLEAARRHLALAEWAVFRAGVGAAGRAGGGTAPVLVPPGRLAAALVRRLPFAPTSSQMAAHAAIRADLAAGRAMRRLVNGDVGSGKTLVAALAVADVVEVDRQALVLAPSETLARQHARTLHEWLAPLGVEVGLLTGTLTARARRPLLASLGTGATHVVVGTHALLSAGVDLAAPGLVVVDEQHRFGVEQRGRLGAKAPGLHALALTATPIPRTLAWMLEGALEVSRLDPRPGTGARITTRALATARLGEVEDRLVAALDAGARAFWVCASIAGTDEEAGAIARHAALAQRLGDRCALLTGRQDPKAREVALAAFRNGMSPLLVATTVVEVGVDVPDASIIVIEGAERFGLAQLHQLRGRVGRRGQPASCVLLHGPELGPDQHARLDLLRRCHDGRTLAEADLAQRGAGDVLGLRQSGALGLRFVDLATDAPLLQATMQREQGPQPAQTARNEVSAAALALFGDQATGAVGVVAG